VYHIQLSYGHNDYKAECLVASNSVFLLTQCKPCLTLFVNKHFYRAGINLIFGTHAIFCFCMSILGCCKFGIGIMNFKNNHPTNFKALLEF